MNEQLAPLIDPVVHFGLFVSLFVISKHFIHPVIPHITDIKHLLPEYESCLVKPDDFSSPLVCLAGFLCLGL